jgi:predicted ATPase
MPGKIIKVVVEGYASIQSAAVDLGDVTILVGANGVGKSNFIDALELLGRIVDNELGLEIGLRGGAQALLHTGPQSASSVRLRIEASATAADATNAYEARLLPAANDTFVFGNEHVYFHAPDYSNPYNESLGSGHRESRLSEAADAKPGKVASRVIDVLRGCRVYHFQDTSRDAPVKQLGYAADNEALRPDAANLAAFLLRLSEHEPVHYKRILAAIRANAPYFRDFVLAEEGNGRIRLRWTQAGVDATFPAEALSDGTLRYICLATLLLQPHPPALIALDEPELGLHPFAITQLADMIASTATHSQVVVATQSVTLLNQFDLGALVVVERDAGSSVLRRPDEERMRVWLDEYSLGELWEKNLLGGRPAAESASAGGR